MRLHVFLAQRGVASRRQAETLIREGKVTVNKSLAVIGQAIDPEKDSICVNGKQITAQIPEVSTYLIYKPAGVVSTTSDELGRPTIVEYLKQCLSLDANSKTEARTKLPRLYPVGRLDISAEGLMILTNDGALTHAYTHPSTHTEKTYHVLLDRFPSEKALEHLRKGVRLKEGFSAPAKVELLSDLTEPWISLTLHEGRYHQVKRMLERVGYTVKHLIRQSIGPYSLDDLKGKVVQKIV